MGTEERSGRWQRGCAWIAKYRFRIGYSFVVLGLALALTGIQALNASRAHDSEKRTRDNAERIYDNCLANQRGYDEQFIAFDVLGSVLHGSPEQIAAAEDLLRRKLVEKYGTEARPTCVAPKRR